jgi:regulator of ribonuclease activity A
VTAKGPFMEPEHHHAHGPANRGRVVLTTTAPLFVCEPPVPAGPVPAGAAVIALHGPHGITAGFEWGLRAVAAHGYLVAAPIHYFRDGGREYVSAVSARRAYAALAEQDINADVDAAVDHVTGRLRLRVAALLGTELAAPAVQRAALRYPRAAALTVPDDGDRDGRAGDSAGAGWLTVARRLGRAGSWPTSTGRAVLPVTAIASPRLSTADLSDEYPDVAQACGGFTQYGGRRWFAGTVATVRCREDTRLTRTVLSEPGDGRVLVVDGGGSLRRALLGDVSAALAAANGWAGVVIHGAVRDAGALRHNGLGVAALGTCPARGGTTGSGERDVAVTVGGALIAPGGYLVADEDGLLFLPQAPAAAPAVPAAPPDHPYRAAVVAGGLAHVSGALGVDTDGRAIPGRRAALAAAMDRLAERLGTVGAGLGDLVKCTFYVTDVSLRAEANDLYRELFPTGPPARTFVEVAALPYGATVEIDAIARANAVPV